MKSEKKISPFVLEVEKLFQNKVVAKKAILEKANLYVTKFNFCLIGKMQLTLDEEKNLRKVLKNCAAELLKVA